MHVFQIDDGNDTSLGVMTIKGESPVAVDLKLIAILMAFQRLAVLELAITALNICERLSRVQMNQ
ncbi:hypothetical protein C7A11_30995 [Pseudomonas simiae]|nr:hypothetical protein C7A11_30995 [Pseudomonas simiae]